MSAAPSIGIGTAILDAKNSPTVNASILGIELDSLNTHHTAIQLTSPCIAACIDEASAYLRKACPGPVCVLNIILISSTFPYLEKTSNILTSVHPYARSRPPMKRESLGSC